MKVQWEKNEDKDKIYTRVGEKKKREQEREKERVRDKEKATNTNSIVTIRRSHSLSPSHHLHRPISCSHCLMHFTDTQCIILFVPQG